jgi:hypothetical protein
MKHCETQKNKHFENSSISTLDSGCDRQQQPSAFPTFAPESS